MDPLTEAADPHHGAKPIPVCVMIIMVSTIHL
jgi:hypothetical protein